MKTDYGMKVFRWIFLVGVIIALYALLNGVIFTVYFQEMFQ